jgi:carbamoyl-phosphate synthase small subunit
MGKKGFLILENGLVFEGQSIGFLKNVDGEVVFNTGMMGYPEGFTDPSYYGQILTLTYPLIGNYGVPPSTQNQGLSDYLESERIRISALIVSTYIENKSHWQAVKSLSQWLIAESVPALSGIDTRFLTQTLREHGVMKGKIILSDTRPTRSGFSFVDINQVNLAEKVSCKEIKKYGKGSLKIAIIDCGLKHNQLKLLLKHDVTIIRIPWDQDPLSMSEQVDAVFISNGPGDPKMVRKTIANVKKVLDRKIPVLGICLGNQILALATGANTYKLKYGHRGQNQPVIDESSKHCYITTQNHGFAVDSKTLKGDWQVWFRNLNDGTCEGIRHKSLPFFSCQFHPESMPGPTDTEWIFDYFIDQIKKSKKIKNEK